MPLQPTSRFPWLELLAVGGTWLSQFVELHIWSPSYSYFMVMLLVVLDVLTDLLLNQRPWRPRVLLLILPAYTVVLAFAHTFGKFEPGLVWLPQAVIVLIVLIHLRRLLRNFSRLHLMDADVAAVLEAKLNRRIERVDAEEPEALPEPAAPPETGVIELEPASIQPDAALPA